jgi:hypothetical protein
MLAGLTALLLVFAPARDLDCGTEGQKAIQELHRQTLELIDKIEADYMRGHGLNDEVIERYVELREKQAELRQWVARCKPIVPRWRG